MKKISISNQIVLLFLSVILISVSLFSIITLSRVRLIAEEETYTRLIAYSKIFESNFSYDEEIGEFRDMELAFIVGDKDIYFYSEDIEKYLSNSDIRKIFSEINAKDSILIADKLYNYNNERIYFVYSTNGDGQGFSLLVTNSTYVSQLVKTVSLQMIILFSVITILSVLAIALWSIKFVNRIHHIQNQILAIPDSYVEPESENFMDEVADLSRSVEKMRIQIAESEKIKREMLQNISHDFKTPIAVIKSYAEAQQDGMADEDSSKIIIDQADILKYKVNRLLQYNSLEYLNKDKELQKVINNVQNLDLRFELKYKLKQLEKDLK